MKKIITHQDVYKVFTALIELEKEFKETGVHTKILADYIDMKTSKVNAIATRLAHANFFIITPALINHKHKIISVDESRGLMLNDKKNFRMGFLIDYKKSISAII